MEGLTAMALEATAYRRAPGAIAAQIDDQMVVLSPVDYSYHALDPVGAKVWTLLVDPLTLDELVDALTVTYDVSSDRCRTDVVPFLMRMTEIGALEHPE